MKRHRKSKYRAIEESLEEIKRNVKDLGKSGDISSDGSSDFEGAGRSSASEPPKGLPKAFSFTPSPAALSERRKAFAPYAGRTKKGHKSRGKGKLLTGGRSSWCHKFVCLRSRCAVTTPRGKEKCGLQQQGLGEIRLSLPKNGTEAEVHSAILRAYPLLSEAGGYTLMVTDCKNATRRFVPLDSPYSVENLKRQVEYQIIFIRPLQNDIGHPVERESSEEEALPLAAMEKCSTCSEVMPMANLIDHVQWCGQAKTTKVDLTCNTDVNVDSPLSVEGSSVLTETLEETRQIVQEQNDAYKRSLEADEKKDRDREAAVEEEACIQHEKRRRQRSARIAKNEEQATMQSLLFDEPVDSEYGTVAVKVKLPDEQEVVRRFCGMTDTLQEVLLWIGTFGCVDSVDLVRFASRMQRGPPTVIAKAKYVLPLSDVFGGSININLVAVNPQDVTDEMTAALTPCAAATLPPRERTAKALDFTSLKGVVANLSAKVQSRGPQDDNYLDFKVRNTHLVQDSLFHVAKKRFDPSRPIKVTFVGESAVDSGGCIREYWRRLSIAVRCKYFQGFNWQLFPRKDNKALLGRHFVLIGKLMATSIAQEGSGFAFLAPSVYEYLVQPDVSAANPSIEEIPDVKIVHWIEKMKSATTDAELQTFLMEDADEDGDSPCKALSDAGYNGALALLTLAKRKDVFKCLTLHTCLLSVKAELDQLRMGLQSVFDVLSFISECPDVMREYFVYDRSTTITAEQLSKLFTKVKYSSKEDEPSQWEAETGAVMQFEAYLEKCEDEQTNCSLENILAFFTGADRIPPGGFKREGTMTFSSSAKYPTASICFLEMTLPTRYVGDDDAFAEALDESCSHIGMLGQV